MRSTVPVLVFVLLITKALAAQKAGSCTMPIAYPGNPEALGFAEFDPDHRDHLGNYKPSYHLGEDWNVGSGNQDYGQDLLAIADGTVVYAGSTGSASIGKAVVLALTLPDDRVVHVVYWHMKDVLVSRDASVTKGQKIGTIGDGDRFYANAHCHFEIRTDTSIPVVSRAYENPLSLDSVTKRVCPSLWIDDRMRESPRILNTFEWNYFTVPWNAPSSTAFVEVGGLRHSMKQAADYGVIYARVYVNSGSGWAYWPDITKVTFEPGRWYAVYGFVKTAKLVILSPGDNFRDERARADMIRAARLDGRFTSVRTETFEKNLDWSPDFQMRWMELEGPSGSSFFRQATLKSNPLRRWTCFKDPTTGRLTSWTPVDSNVLQ